jgi:hypothetical protein
LNFPKLILCLFFLSTFFISKGQDSGNTHSVYDEVRFVEYLSSRSMDRDALVISNRLLNSSAGLSSYTLDSLYYFKAWSFYKLMQADSAAAYFTRVQSSPELTLKSFYYGIFNRIYVYDFSSAAALLKKDTTEQIKEYRNFNLSAIALLQKDFDSFDSLARGYSFTKYQFAEEQKNMLRYADTLRKYSTKSPFVAGTLSAIVPGLGKIYAGKTGQGIAAFLEIAALGGATAEYYFRSGPESAGFIIFGSLFSLFYIGNIWGSALSVSVNKNDFYKRIDNNIMVDLHIPLRRVFN